jgi:hypothetical protein
MGRSVTYSGEDFLALKLIELGHMLFEVKTRLITWSGHLEFVVAKD